MWICDNGQVFLSPNEASNIRAVFAIWTRRLRGERQGSIGHFSGGEKCIKVNWTYKQKRLYLVRKKMTIHFDEMQRNLPTEIYRGYYMPVRGYEFYLRVFNPLSHEWALWTSEISSWTREEKNSYPQAGMQYYVYYINTSEKGAFCYVIITTVKPYRSASCPLEIWCS